MTKYLVFAGNIQDKWTYGWQTFKNDFYNLDEAKKYAINLAFPDRDEVPITDEELIANDIEKNLPLWSQIVDLETFEVIEEYA